MYDLEKHDNLKITAKVLKELGITCNGLNHRSLTVGPWSYVQTWTDNQ